MQKRPKNNNRKSHQFYKHVSQVHVEMEILVDGLRTLHVEDIEKNIKK